MGYPIDSDTLLEWIAEHKEYGNFMVVNDPNADAIFDAGRFIVLQLLLKDILDERFKEQCVP